MANTNESGNTTYKNDVFWLLLQEKERALEIYNAINGTTYDDPELVEINTLQDSGFTLSIRNDASFILDANLSLYEHQSTYCPNMPLREYHAKSDYIDLEGAIKQAIQQCIREDVLKEFLIKHGKEVMDVMTLDYTFERRLELQREEGVEEGWRLGEEQGRKLGEKDGMQKKLHDQISKKLRKNKSLEQIADELEETPDSIRPLYEQVKEELAEK